MIEIGKPAPDWSLENESGEVVKLNDYSGKWLVIYFYPKDSTPGCTIQANDFTALKADFDAAGVEILGCSPDGQDSHQRFIKNSNLTISLLSDPDHEMMTEYCSWGEKNMYGKITVGVIRSTVIIDPNGNIGHHWKRAQAKNHANKVLEKIAVLQKVFS